MLTTLDESIYDPLRGHRPVGSRRQLDKKPIVLVTMGDFNGIGAEVALKAVSSPVVQKLCRPVLAGSMDVFKYYARNMRRKIFLAGIENLSSLKSHDDTEEVPVLHLGKSVPPHIAIGKVSKEAGRYAAEAIEVSANLCLREHADAMVTAPVSKEAMHAAGYRHHGQTDLLAEICGGAKVAMMLIANKFRVGLTTVHLPLKDVHRFITRRLVFEKLSVVHRSLEQDFAIPSPTIAVLGLNPHAGENSILGAEEKREILPALRKARLHRMHAEGPFPADGFFGTHAYTGYDAVLAMYHDQGLIPFKMIGFDMGVNFTAGLPIVRTSPDHGTAFEIAGKNIASPASMIEAIKMAVTIVRNRQKSN